MPNPPRKENERCAENRFANGRSTLTGCTSAQNFCRASEQVCASVVSKRMSWLSLRSWRSTSSRQVRERSRARLVCRCEVEQR